MGMNNSSCEACGGMTSRVSLTIAAQRFNASSYSKKQIITKVKKGQERYLRKSDRNPDWVQGGPTRHPMGRIRELCLGDQRRPVCFMEVGRSWGGEEGEYQRGSFHFVVVVVGIRVVGFNVFVSTFCSWSSCFHFQVR